MVLVTCLLVILMMLSIQKNNYIRTLLREHIDVLDDSILNKDILQIIFLYSIDIFSCSELSMSGLSAYSYFNCLNRDDHKIIMSISTTNFNFVISTSCYGTYCNKKISNIYFNYITHNSDIYEMSNKIESRCTSAHIMPYELFKNKYPIYYLTPHVVQIFGISSIPKINNILMDNIIQKNYNLQLGDAFCATVYDSSNNHILIKSLKIEKDKYNLMTHEFEIISSLHTMLETYTQNKNITQFSRDLLLNVLDVDF